MPYDKLRSENIDLEARLIAVNEQLRIATAIINTREDTLWRQGRKVEYLLIVGSLVAAYRLMTPPANFGWSNTYEFYFGLFILTGCGLKVAAMVLYETGTKSLANLMRLIALGFSTVFWIGLGVTVMIHDGTPLCGIGSIIVGSTAYVMLHRLARSRWWNGGR